jgi:hypothetical protein
MIIQGLSKSAIEEVFENLDEAGRTEFQLFGSTVEDLKNKFLDHIHTLFAAAFCDDQGKPCALLFLESTGPKSWRTQFAMRKEGLKEIGFSLTRFLRKISDDMAVRGHFIEILSAHGNGKTARWFKVMGFRHLGPEGDIHRYSKGW